MEGTSRVWIYKRGRDIVRSVVMGKESAKRLVAAMADLESKSPVFCPILSGR